MSRFFAHRPTFVTFGRMSVVSRWLAVLTTLSIVLLAGASRVWSQPHSGIPTISIVSVQQGESVTVRTHNFPAGYTFAVTMGKMGTRGIGGALITNTPSGRGGSFDVTYPIPEGLKDDHQIAIRLQTGHAKPYYAFNWFYNNTTPVPAIVQPASNLATTPEYTGIPTFEVVEVLANKSVTIETNNFPANQTFNVTMGVFGTRGIGGVVVTSFSSDGGGTMTKTFAIPAALHGYERIAIRTQTAHANPYFSYNWFFNDTTGQGTQQPETQVPAAPAYTGIPTFTVCVVERNSMVTISTSKLPANQTFYVTMGPMGKRGVNGYAVSNFHSGDGSPQRLTFTIPAQMHGAHQIAIRAATGHAYPYYAYNWFYNNTAAVC